MAGIENGWIKFWRSFLTWEWYNDINVKVLFLHLLLSCNYEDVKWQGRIIKRGQLVTSVGNLAKELNLTDKQIRLALDKLSSTGEIVKQGTNKFTIITICKYDSYQQDEIFEGQTKGNQKAIEGQTKGDNERSKEIKEINNTSSSLTREENFFSELGKTDTEFFTLVCMRLSIDSVLYKALLQDFIQECKMRDKWHLSMQDAKNHFVDWSRKELERRNKPKQQNNGVQAKYDPTGSYEPKSTREDYFL